GAAGIYIHVGRNGWQDVVDPDPLMTQVESYWEYTYIMPTNTTIIDAVFTDGAGVWDNNGGADWHVAVTNCGEAPEPLPAVSISPTNAGACDPITITYNPAGRVLLGVNPVKIHIGHNGWQDVILPNPNMTASGSYWTYVYSPPPGATNIDVVFNDGASTWDNNDGADWHFDIADCPDIPTGLAITNPPNDIVVSNSVTTYDLQGIADGMEGDLAWTNSLTGASGTLPAAAAWSLPGLALGVGGNEFIITGSNTTAAGTATNAVDNASDAAYSDGWNTGNNGGTGFGGWTLNAVEGSSGHFTDARGWGMWTQEGDYLSESIRPFSSPLTTGQTFHVRMQNGWVESGGSIGVALQTAEGVTVWECYFNGGDTNYNVSTGVTDIAWTDAGLDITYEITGPSDCEVSIQPLGGGDLRQYTGTVGGQIARFRAWSYSNGTDDGQNTNRNFYINNLKITSPTGDGVATNADFVVITRQSGGGPVPPEMAFNPDFTGQGLGFRVMETVAGAEYAVWASPVLFPTQNWQKIAGTETNASGGPVDMSITNDLLPTNFYRIGYTP
ncbi:MAG TPA: carbohydrate-binding protein, partial [Kiritimatiellia bacterium]|nr:carbohydrate-binding protein [Kiritimatiellia bacterium]